MTPDEALAYYLGPHHTVTPKTLEEAVCRALQEAAVRRKEGPAATAAVIRLAHDELKMTYRGIEAASETDRAGGARIDAATAQRIDSRNPR